MPYVIKHRISPSSPKVDKIKDELVKKFGTELTQEIFTAFRNIYDDLHNINKIISGEGEEGGYLQDPGANGIVVRTAETVTTARTLQEGDAYTSITYPDGVSGNPIIGVVIAAIIQAVLDNLLSGAQYGDIFFVNKDIDETLFIDKRRIGKNTQVLTTEGTIPFWDYVGNTPGAETSSRYTKVLFQYVYVAKDKITMDKTIDLEDEMTFEETHAPDEQDTTPTVEVAADKVTMDKTQDLEDEITSEYSTGVA